MLRIEQTFPSSVYDSDDSNLTGYTEYHRLLMPNLIAADIHRDRDLSVNERITRVESGLARSATLALELRSLEIAHQSKEWQDVVARLNVRDAIKNSWRITRREDPHALYPGHAVWTATRTLANLSDTDDDLSPRVRERYTFTSSSDLSTDELQKLIVNNEVDEDIVLATATVYAINKAVEKPRVATVDMKSYPTTAAMLKRR